MKSFHNATGTRTKGLFFWLVYILNVWKHSLDSQIIFTKDYIMIIKAILSLAILDHAEKYGISDILIRWLTPTINILLTYLLYMNVYEISKNGMYDSICLLRNLGRELLIVAMTYRNGYKLTIQSAFIIMLNVAIEEVNLDLQVDRVWTTSVTFLENQFKWISE